MEVLLLPADADIPDGPEVVHKTATLAGERERLLREADVLRMATTQGLPGLARVVTYPASTDAEPCLVTSAATGPSLALAPPLPVIELARLAAEVARLLAGLHEGGLVHGAVEPGHVVLDGRSGVILVGLGDGGRIGDKSTDLTAGPLDPASDVAGWGALVSHLLDWSATRDEDEPLTALRHGLAARVRRNRGPRPIQSIADSPRRVLAALADQAQDPDPARRPTARSLAIAVIHRVPAAQVPSVPDSTSDASASPAPLGTGLLNRLSRHLVSPDSVLTPPRTRSENPCAVDQGNDEAAGSAEARQAQGPAPQCGRRPATIRNRRRWASVGGVTATITLFSVWAAMSRPQTTEPVARSTIVRPQSVNCPPVPQPAADIDGDSCEEALVWANGVLQAGLARFAFGAPGDAWTVGDWDGDGRRTPALLHQGVLAIFDAWPGPNGVLTGRPVATQSDATGLSLVTGPEGYDQISLHGPNNSTLIVDVRPIP